MSGDRGQYRRYKQLKDSGLEWVGRIPSDWATLRNKFAASYVKGRNPQELQADGGEGLIPYLSMGYLRGHAEAQYAKHGPGCTLTVSGQVLVIWDGSNAGEFVRARAGLLSSTMASADVSETFDDGYYWYACKALEPELRRTAVGMGIPHVDGAQLRGAGLPLPSPSEQTQIANFLDYETAKIDTLIEKQQQLISLLKEKRQAVISHAVTKGLNPDAPMRDSGVEWLGEVPAHWEVAPLKRVIVLQRGHDLPAEARRDGNYPVVSSAGPIGTHIDFKCKGPGIVTGRYGTIGEFYYVPTEFWPLNTALYSINCHGNHERLLFYMLQNMKHLFVLNSLKAAVPGVDRNDVHREHVAVTPDDHEQRAIADYLDDRMIQFDALTARAEDLVSTLQERRTALISAAVTGKIDVRDWSPPESAPDQDAA